MVFILTDFYIDNSMGQVSELTSVSVDEPLSYFVTGSYAVMILIFVT